MSSDSVYVSLDASARPGEGPAATAQPSTRRVLGLSLPTIALVCVGLCGAVTAGAILGQQYLETRSADSTKSGAADNQVLLSLIGDKKDYRNQTRKWNCGECWCVPGEGEVCPQRPPEYTSHAMARFNSQKLTNPMTLTCNPYKSKKCQTEPAQTSHPDSAVCAVRYSTSDCDEYSMDTFPSATAAAAAGFSVTHTGACGVCSSLQDLAVYMRHFDMTSLGKACAKRAMLSTSWGESCYKELGFTDDCSRIWTYNSQNTGTSCFFTCVWNIRADYNVPPGCEINNCLQCDEDESGPLFQKFAGRTRRRSGLESSIQRPCDTVAHVTHHSCVAPAQ